MPTYLDEDQKIELRNPGKYKWVITNGMNTNVAGASCTYDRIIVASAMNAKFTGEAGVLRFDEVYELDCEPKQVSDHYPVYGVFRVEQIPKNKNYGVHTLAKEILQNTQDYN